jgi:glycosyltransferase involved in cell wall biosynthesis
MKIIVCNKFFFLNGGTEKYLHALTDRLSATGHEPVPFSVNYAGSWPSPYSRFFMRPPGPADEIFYSDITLRPASILRYIDRSVYSVEARLKLSRLLRATGGADIAYLLNIYNYMSPSIIHTFRARGIPVVMRLGDYNLQCPSYLFLRSGAPCTLCMQGSYWQGLHHRCVKGSLAASALRVMAMYVHRALSLYAQVAAFVVPCTFMREQLIQGGFPEERIHVIRSPAVSETAAAGSGQRRHILYFGRISPEKGLDTLIEAWGRLADAPELIIAGRSYDNEQERLEKLVPSAHRARITFTGFQDSRGLGRLIDEALLTVVPSRWYDNAPLSVHESFQHATPVVAARIGGIPEQVQHGVTGMLFEPGSVEGLRQALQSMLSDREGLDRMGRSARDYVTRECGMDLHAERLLDLFERVRRHGN